MPPSWIPWNWMFCLFLWIWVSVPVRMNAIYPDLHTSSPRSSRSSRSPKSRLNVEDTVNSLLSLKKPGNKLFTSSSKRSSPNHKSSAYSQKALHDYYSQDVDPLLFDVETHFKGFYDPEFEESIQQFRHDCLDGLWAPGDSDFKEDDVSSTVERILWFGLSLCFAPFSCEKAV